MLTKENFACKVVYKTIMALKRKQKDVHQACRELGTEKMIIKMTLRLTLHRIR